ncbi:hypothetical protein SH449x_000875 [Pirellulaceae bacterium SH449]
MITDAYQPTSHDSQSLQTDRRHWFVRSGAFLLLLTGPLWIVMSGLQSKLLSAGIINTKDLGPLFGSESGTLIEHLLNVWHWDAAIFLLLIATIPNTLFATWLLRKRLKTTV